jgi:sugar phosphate isomerase/epimerase
MLGISTSWWQNRVEHAGNIVRDVLDLGLSGVELEYRITPNMLHEMKPQLNGRLSVLSIHNFFPLPPGFGPQEASGDLFLLSSTDSEERSRAVRYTIQTIQHACDMGAPAVVLHLGRVDMPNPAAELSRLYANGKTGRAQMAAFIDEQRRGRQRTHQRNLDAVLLSLDELNREAQQRGVLLGIENRFHFHEIPDFEEIEVILNRFEGGHIGYWHDIGHARVQENAGILRRNQLLEAYSEKIIGVHIHDVSGFTDHLAPGQGDIDYGEIRPYLTPALPIILELSASRVNRKDLENGLRLLQSSVLNQLGA